MGFLVSEGILSAVSDLREIRPHPRNRHGNVLDVFLAPGRHRGFFTAHAARLCILGVPYVGGPGVVVGPGTVFTVSNQFASLRIGCCALPD